MAGGGARLWLSFLEPGHRLMHPGRRRLNLANVRAFNSFVRWGRRVMLTAAITWGVYCF
jgi:hypothetical protein